MDTEHVILVDEHDNVLGLMEKQEAHEKGLLHRAFSVFVFNNKGELLLQQRAASKYHSAGLWTNTCCSHPRGGETTAEAAQRRLREEMGIACALEEKFHFIYRTPFDNGLTEHELDFVYTGTFNDDPQPNQDEVAAYRWIAMPDLQREMSEQPELFTSWFRIILDAYAQRL